MQLHLISGALRVRQTLEAIFVPWKSSPARQPVKGMPFTPIQCCVFDSWTQRLPIFPISFCLLKAYFVLIWKWPYKRGRDREKEQILSTLEKKKATKPTVQIGHIAQIKFSGSKIISSSSYPSIPLPVPPTIVSNEERKQNWISSFLLQCFTLWSKATNRVPMENSKCKETPEHPTWDEVPLPH